MIIIRSTKSLLRLITSRLSCNQYRHSHNVFGIRDLLQPEKHEPFKIQELLANEQTMAVDTIKRHYLSEHVLSRSRHFDFSEDRAIDEYIIGLLKQGNSIYAKTEDGSIAGMCINFALSPVDPSNLRNYAFYRQNPNVKDYLYFTAKLQETPNLWKIFQQKKIFEIKMLTVLPEYRRQGLATTLAEKSKKQAQELGYNVVRMDCINPYDFKIAERCKMSCLVKFPLHKLRGPNTPFIKRTSEQNRYVRVYVHVQTQTDKDREIRRDDLVNLLE